MLGKVKFLLHQPWLALRDWVAPAQELPVPGAFVKGINFGGGVVVVAGDRWHSYPEALASGLSAPGVTVASMATIPHPYASRGVRTMLNTVIFKTQTLDLEQTLPNDRYDLYLWVMENYQTHWHSLDVMVAGQPIAQGIGHLPLGDWSRYGPYAIAVDDGRLRLSITTHDPNIDAHVMGMSLFKRP